MVFALVLERLESLSYGILGQTVYPESLHGTGGLCLQHHPALYEFTLLSGIAAVDYLGGLAHKLLDGAELMFHPLVGLQFDAEARWYHGQASQAPCLPQRSVVGWLLEFTQVTESPCHLISIPFHVSIPLLVSTQDMGYISCNGGFLRNTYYHLCIDCLDKGNEKSPSFRLFGGEYWLGKAFFITLPLR